MTFTVLDNLNRCPCESRDDAKLRAYAWTAWAKQCAARQSVVVPINDKRDVVVSPGAHRMTFDDVGCTITVECFGMTSVYVY